MLTLGRREGASGARGCTNGRQRNVAAVDSKGIAVLRLKGRKRLRLIAGSVIEATAKSSWI